MRHYPYYPITLTCLIGLWFLHVIWSYMASYHWFFAGFNWHAPDRSARYFIVPYSWASTVMFGRKIDWSDPVVSIWLNWSAPPECNFWCFFNFNWETAEVLVFESLLWGLCFRLVKEPVWAAHLLGERRASVSFQLSAAWPCFFTSHKSTFSG